MIAASRTRPRLLDDACRLAAAPRLAIGFVNSHVHAAWIAVSHTLYDERDAPAQALHEFQANAGFAQWCCGLCGSSSRPSMRVPVREGVGGPYIVGFVGANTRSGRWPAVYPEVFNRKRRRLGDFPCRYAEVVSADIASIPGRRVFDAMQDLVSTRPSWQAPATAPSRAAHDAR